MLAVLALFCLGAGSAHAASANFNGTSVSGCSLSGSVYTCAGFPITSGNNTDVLTIASGYTVNIGTNAVFTYNQGLVMSGTATLSVLGTLDIKDMNPAYLKVTGGTLTAKGQAASGSTPAITGTFLAGASSQTLTANINADTAKLGTAAVTVTGNIKVTGSIDFASYSTVNGNIDAGSVSGGTIASPATNITVNGTINATTSIMLPNQSKVSGDVTTGTLTLLASGVTLSGNATVASAVLQSGTRVVKTIYCTGGTTSGNCDCVTNNSGWAVNTANGPTCQSKQAVAPPVLDHFQITHDGAASACTPETITIAACANASCSSYFTGGATGTLSPGSTKFTIGSSGTVQSTVSQSTVGQATLAITNPGTTPASSLICTNTTANTTGTGSCTMAFDGNVGLTLQIPDQYAGDATKGTLSSNVYYPATQACGPGFTAPQNVQLSCTYTNPSGGSQPVKIAADSNTSISATSTCGGPAGQLTNLPFGSNGSVDVQMTYPDVGAVTVKLSTSYKGSTISATDQIIVAPAKYSFATLPAAPIIAGKSYTLTVSAMTRGNTIAANFGKESTPETIALGYGAPSSGETICVNRSSPMTALPTTVSGVSAGVVTASTAYPEAGTFEFAVRQASCNYLGGAVNAPAANLSSAQRAYPAYFTTKTGVGRTSPAYYYSGQPIDVIVTAMNAAGVPTTRYSAAQGFSNDVQLSLADPASAGTMAGGLIKAAQFSNGVGNIWTAASTGVTTATSPAFTYTFGSVTTNPTTVTLGAVETVATNTVKSADAAAKYGRTGAEGTTEIRSGRIRIGGAFGGAKGDLDLPVRVEYYAANAWRVNASETFTTPILAAAVGIATTSSVTGGTFTASNVTGGVSITNGIGKVTLRPTAGIGTAVVMINLGNTVAAADKPDASCIPSPAPAVSGAAAMPWLRSPNGVCATGKSGDPVARATFGIFSPETKRIIHVREVFN